MTDNKVMEWLKNKEMRIKNKAANSMYTYGVTLSTSDLPYINKLKHILGVRIGTKIDPSYDTGYKDGLEKAWEIAKKNSTTGSSWWLYWCGMRGDIWSV